MQGSECKSAWNIITRLSFKHELTVFCAETNQFMTTCYKDQIEEFRQSFDAKTKIIYIKQPFITRAIAAGNKFFFSKNSNIGNNILYFIGVRFWEKSLYNFVRKNFLKQDLPDIFHHFNHISFREPGYCWKIDIPFVWGPVSGMVSPPKNYISSLSPGLRKSIMFRNYINLFQARHDKRISKAISKSSHIFCVGSEDYNFFYRHNKNISYMSDMGTEPDNIIVTKKNYQTKLTISMIGRLDLLKAPQIVLECFRSSKKISNNAILQIIGDGNLMDQLINKYSKDLSSAVKWLGKIPYDDVKKKLSASDLLIHPSIKEAGSAVVLEALEQSVPVVCHDAFGMAHTINEYCGIKIKMHSFEQSVLQFSNAIETLIDDRDKVKALQEGARIRSQELSWVNMVNDISNKYNDILLK